MIKKAIVFAALIALSALAVMGYLRKPLRIDIDNAYVSGRIFKVYAPRSGYIDLTSIQKGESFAAGAATVIYDQSQIDLAISQQAAQYRLNINEEIGNCFALEKALKEQEKLQVEMDYNEKRYHRTNSMKDGRSLLSPEEVDERNNRYFVAKKNVDVSAIEVERLKSINNLPILERASVRHSENILREKLHEKSLHEITLPFGGYVYESMMYPGKYVSEGEMLAIVVPREKLMIEANVLESKLSGIVPNQRVDIELDTHRGTILEGYVQGVVPSTAGTFSSLPRNNTDSNWIKVSQRVPVLVGFASPPPENLNLALGASARLSIHLDEEIEQLDMRPAESPTVSHLGTQQRQDAFVENIVTGILSSLSGAERSACRFES